MSKRLRYAIETRAFGLLLVLGGLIPRRLLLPIGCAAARLYRRFDSRHRDVAMQNLQLVCGPRLDPRRARQIVRGCWCHFGRVTLDTLAFYRMSPERMRRLVSYEGLEHIRAAYAKGKGVLLFSGHFGHWELTALMQGYLDLPLALVARPLDNPQLERMLAGLRQCSGNRVVHKRNAVREMLRALREGAGVAIVIDQDAGAEGVFVPFFGRPASTTPTLALLALRTGAPIVPSFSVPLPDGTYRIVYEPEVEFDPSGDRDRDVLELTARCTAMIERWVRQFPELWLWMHRRWKTRPPSG